MPTYEYECENGHRFEVFQSMKDEPLQACTECSAPVRRIIGPGAGFLFKGSGFYITEYRSKEYQKKAKAESAGGSSGTSGAGSGAAGGASGGGEKSGSGGSGSSGGEKSGGGGSGSSGGGSSGGGTGGKTSSE